MMKVQYILALSMRFRIGPRFVPEHSVQRLAVRIHAIVHILAVAKTAPQSNGYGRVIAQIEIA
jgi:hypothetical protein